jgi:hypothetical protein
VLAGDATNGRVKVHMKHRAFITFSPPTSIARADAPIE